MNTKKSIRTTIRRLIILISLVFLSSLQDLNGRDKILLDIEEGKDAQVEIDVKHMIQGLKKDLRIPLNWIRVRRVQWAQVTQERHSLVQIYWDGREAFKVLWVNKEAIPLFFQRLRETESEEEAGEDSP